MMNRRSLFSAVLVIVALCGGFFAGRVQAAQPHMNSALDHLRIAQHELDLALADKGGHRARAVALVNQAISEVEAGMSFARVR